MSATESLVSWREVMCESVRNAGPDLSMRQWAILLTVYLNPGPHTVRGLARDLNVPKPAISRALDALSILGFIRRIRDAHDKRIVLVQKTPDGAIFLEKFGNLVAAQSGGDAGMSALYG